MEINKVTRDDITKYLENSVKNGVISEMIKNRLIKILDHCNNIQIFCSMSNEQLLGTARKLGIGGEQDLGNVTYNAFNSLVAHIKEMQLSKKRMDEERILEQKKLELELAKENPTFTTEQMKGLATFMELSNAKRVDLKKIKAFFDCFEF